MLWLQSTIPFQCLAFTLWLRYYSLYFWLFTYLLLFFFLLILNHTFLFLLKLLKLSLILLFFFFFLLKFTSQNENLLISLFAIHVSNCFRSWKIWNSANVCQTMAEEFIRRLIELITYISVLFSIIVLLNYAFKLGNVILIETKYLVYKFLYVILFLIFCCFSFLLLILWFFLCLKFFLSLP